MDPMDAMWDPDERRKADPISHRRDGKSAEKTGAR